MKKTTLVVILGFILLMFAGCGSEDSNDTDGDTADGDTTDGDKADGDTTDGDTPDGDTADGDTADGDTTDGDAADGDATDGDAADGDAADGDSVDGDVEDSADIWEDESTTLFWQVEAKKSEIPFDDAVTLCDELSLGGYDDWRLPSITELRSLIRGCPGGKLGGNCGVLDDCTDEDCWNADCLGCTALSGPGKDGFYQPAKLNTTDVPWFWSSTLHTNTDYSAWNVFFDQGGVGYYSNVSSSSARCVRGEIAAVDGDMDSDSDNEIDSDATDGEVYVSPNMDDAKQICADLETSGVVFTACGQPDTSGAHQDCDWFICSYCYSFTTTVGLCEDYPTMCDSTANSANCLADIVACTDGFDCSQYNLIDGGQAFASQCQTPFNECNAQ